MSKTAVVPTRPDPSLSKATAEACRRLVAGLIHYPQALDDIPAAAALKPGDFCDQWLQDVFKAISEIYHRNPSSTGGIDCGAVWLWLRTKGNWDEKTALADVADLAAEEQTGASVGYWSKVVRKHSLLRMMLIASTQIERLALDPAEAADLDPDGTLAELATILDPITADPTSNEPVTIRDAIREGLEELKARSRRDGGRLSTGFVDLDQLVPSLDPGQLIVIGARPSVGKTALATALAVNASHLRGVPTYFASLEMSRSEVGQRVAYLLTGMPGHRFRAGKASQTEFDGLGFALELSERNPLWVDDTPGLRVGQIASAARRVKRRNNGHLGLIVVDYLQLVAPDDRRSDRREQVEQVSRNLKRLARELSVPVVALAQLNREVEARPDGKPKLSDLREAGGIEQDADAVMLLWRHPGQMDEAEIITVGLSVAKQRNGPTGEISLNYRRACMRFEDRAPVGV